jgi:DNA-binding LacI/PurR family transcriptional regulator
LTLRQRILDGHYPAGSWLPAERTLAVEYSRSAIRIALRRLEEDRLIVREPGRRPWVQGGSEDAPDPDGSDAPSGSGTLTFSDGQSGSRTPVAISMKPAVGTILAVLPQNLVYPAAVAILHGVNAVLRSKNAPFRVQFLDVAGENQSNAADLEIAALESALNEGVDGVILWNSAEAESMPLLRQLREAGIPVVFVDRYPTNFPCDYVGVDNQSAVSEAIGYLYRLGHRRIAHLTADVPNTAVRERLAAYRDALAAFGITPRPEWIWLETYGSDIRRAVDHFFSIAERPTALFAINDSVAHHFIAIAEAVGKRVPDDLSVIGFDDLERHSPRPALLTTLHQPFENIGRRAMEILLRRIAEPESMSAAEHILFQAPLIVRSTCKAVG